MNFRLLGAVEAWLREQQVDLGPRKQRLVLAILALQVNQLVPVDRLVDLAWPTSPPPTARHAIHVSVSRLRRSLANGDLNGDTRIITRGSGYSLRADPMCIDAHRFRTLVTKARAANSDMWRVHLLRQALSLWHGPPLADVATAAADHLCRGLEEARLAAWEDWLDAELRLGRHQAVIGDLTEFAEQHPYRQQPVAMLMLALYRAGRAPDALSVYQLARSRLVEELGIDPGPGLRQLENAILAADPGLDLPRTQPGDVLQIAPLRPYPLPRQASGEWL